MAAFESYSFSPQAGPIQKGRDLGLCNFVEGRRLGGNMSIHQISLFTDHAVLVCSITRCPVAYSYAGWLWHGGAVCNTLVACAGWGGAYVGRINELPERSPERHCPNSLLGDDRWILELDAAALGSTLHTPKHQRVRKDDNQPTINPDPHEAGTRKVNTRDVWRRSSLIVPPAKKLGDFFSPLRLGLPLVDNERRFATSAAMATAYSRPYLTSIDLS